MVLAIEPMINMGVKEVVHLDDGWTVLTKDRMPSAHFMNMTFALPLPILIFQTPFAEIEEAEKGMLILPELLRSFKFSIQDQ